MTMDVNAAVNHIVDERLSHVHTALPASVVEYAYMHQKVTIQPLIDKTLRDGRVIPLPPITDVPVHFQASGGASLTFPLERGDTGFFICCERSIDQWLTKGRRTPPLDTRKFDLSDAIFIPGILPFSKTSPASNNRDVELKFKGSAIKISSSGSVTVDAGVGTLRLGNSAQELLDLFDQLLGSLITSTTPGGPLSNIAEMETIRGSLGLLKS